MDSWEHWWHTCFHSIRNIIMIQVFFFKSTKIHFVVRSAACKINLKFNCHDLLYENDLLFIFFIQFHNIFWIIFHRNVKISYPVQMNKWINQQTNDRKKVKEIKHLKWMILHILCKQTYKLDSGNLSLLIEFSSFFGWAYNNLYEAFCKQLCT